MKQTRREFIKSVSVASAGLAIGLNARSYSRIMGANDRVNFAIIGLNGRGYAHLSSIHACRNTAITHVCDVDGEYLKEICKRGKRKI